MSSLKPRLPLLFAGTGHALMHYFGACYFVIVLSLESVWQRPYHELLELWTLGALLVGLMALPAGWLADRWSAPGMMAVMFFGLGLTGIASGLADEPASLHWGLAGIGFFAAIYHPVGIAWVVRTATSRGRSLGINGVFGSLGVASGGAVSGLLIDGASWRAAFIVPAVASLGIGLALAWCMRQGWVPDDALDATPDTPAGGRAAQVRAFALLLITMAAVGLMFQATQTALPKLFELRLGARLGEGLSGVGALVAIVYFVAGFTQLIGGRMADRLPLEGLYAAGLLLAAPLNLVMAWMSGWPLLGVAMLAAFANAAVLPAENMLLARLAPARHRSLAYGLKFVVAFGIAPVAVQLVAWIQATTGTVDDLFRLLAAIGAGAAGVALTLPRVYRGATEVLPPPLTGEATI